MSSLLPAAALLAAALLLFSGGSSASAFVTTPITIDGDLSDWAGVRLDPANSIGDSVIPDDPDYPGQPDRDCYLASATYDDEYLYLSWRRTAGGVKAITFGAFIDIGGDGLLQDGDRVVSWTVGSGNPYASAQSPSPSAWIFLYNQARVKQGNNVRILNPAGDPMGGDGDTPDGWADEQSGRILPAKTMDGYLNPVDGIECEARVAWSDLGIPAGTPINIHFSSGNGNSWGAKNVPSNTWKWTGSPPQYLEENRGQIEDNLGGRLSLSRRAVLVEPDRSGGGAAGSWVTYSHTVTNTGNLGDTFDLTTGSAQGWTTQVTGAGGAPLSSVALSSHETTTVLLRVFVPAGIPAGTLDTATLRATSRADGGVTDGATDSTVVGSLTVFPWRSGSMAPGQTIAYSFTVQNNGAAGVFDLATASTLGFPAQVVDGAGAPLSAIGLASGEATTVVVRVGVPAGATVGVQDVTRLTAIRRDDPAVTATARATTTVLDGLTIAPDRALDAGPGIAVSYTHTVTNSWPTTRTIALAGISSNGWPVTVFDSDGVTPLASVDVGPNGGSRTVIARVFVPTTAASGATDYTVVTASVAGASDSVTDVTTIHHLATYGSPSYGSEADRFCPGDRVYSRGMGLGSYSEAYFVWKDPSGTTIRTSPAREIDTQGMAYDDYTLAADAALGTWTVELRDARTNVLIESTSYDVSFAADITALYATDAATVGTTVTVSAASRNRSTSPIVGSTMTYVVWWDANGDATFGAGDTYIDASGTPHAWDGSTPVSSHVTTGVDAPAGGTWSEPGWAMSNRDFPNQGTYNLTATWRTNAGALIDAGTTQFFSVPTLGELVGGIAASMASFGTLATPGGLPIILVAVLLWAAALAHLHRTRHWLTFYALGALGSVLVALFLAQALGLDTRLEGIEAAHVAALAALLRINVAALPPSGLAIQNHVGWGVFDIGIECSALLEMAALAGLVGFYPAFGRGRKGAIVAAGVVATYAINVARILLIVGMISALGTGWVFIAHAVVGRIFFFTGVVVVYWLLVTTPTVGWVSRKLSAAAAQDDSAGGGGVGDAGGGPLGAAIASAEDKPSSRGGAA